MSDGGPDGGVARDATAPAKLAHGRQVVTAVAVAVAARATLLALCPTPLFTTDSHSYLHTAKAWWISAVRPAGTGIFYRLVGLLHGGFFALLVAQAALGVATSLLVLAIAAELRLRPLPALAAALLAALSPSSLLFGHAMHSEALAQLATAAFVLAFLVARRNGADRSWMLAGLLASIATVVRSVLGTLIPAVWIALAASAVRGAPRRAARCAVTFTLAALPVLIGYASVARIAFGSFGLTFFDGASLFAVVADRTDCSDVARGPAIRASLCASESLLSSEPADILWGPGPIQDAVRDRGWPEVNRELRAIAVENVRRHPLHFAEGCWARVRDALALKDPPYLGALASVGHGAAIASDFGLDLGSWTDESCSAAWNAVLSAWYAMRRVLWLGLAVAPFVWLVAPRRDRAPIAALLVMAWLIFAATVVFSYTTPRLLHPLETFGIVVTAWSADRLLAWRAARAHRPVGPLAGRPRTS